MHATATVTLSGEIDLASQESVRRALERAGLGRVTVTVDLAGVTFMDSIGLHTLLEANQRQHDAGLSLILRSPSPPVGRLFDLVGVRPILDIEA